MKHRRFGRALALACAVIVGIPAVVGIAATVIDYNNLPAAASLGPTDGVAIVQGGAVKKWLPFNYFLDHTASNVADAAAARTNLGAMARDASNVNTATTARGNLSAMARDASDATLPTALQSLGANRNGQKFYAETYAGAVSGAACTWDATHDVGDCINAAVAAAKAAGGGSVVLPIGTYGLSVKLSQTSSPGIMVEGAGAPGHFGICKTTLTWIGAVNGTMLDYAPASNNIVGGGAKSLCFKGGATSLGAGADIALRLRAVSQMVFEDVYVEDVQAAAWDLDAGDWANGGLSENLFSRDNIKLSGAGAVSAKGWKLGQGATVTGNDTWGNTWLGGLVQHQNGTAFECGAADSNRVLGMDTQTIGGGTGTSLHMLGHATVSNLKCRSNRFLTNIGWGQGVASRPIADTDTFPSVNNYVYQTFESGGAAPLINGSAILSYESNDGNQSPANHITLFNAKHIESRDSGGTARSLIQLDVTNKTILDGGAGGLQIRTNNGGTTAATADTSGNWTLGGNLVINNLAQIDAKDSGGTTRSLLQLDGSNRTILDGGAGGLLIRANNGAATAATIDASGNFVTGAQFTMPNATAFNMKDSGGTGRSVLQYTSGNIVILDGGTAGSTFRNGGGGRTWLTVDTGSSKVLAQYGATNGVPIHIGTAQTTAPALSSCGTSPAIVGTDEAGEVTMGTGTPTGCVITFNQAYVGAPLCVVTWQATPLASQSYAVSNTAITLTQTATDSNKVNYICRARAGG